MKPLTLIVVLALVYCTTTPASPPAPNPWDGINTGLQRYRGRDARARCRPWMTE